MVPIFFVLKPVLKILLSIKFSDNWTTIISYTIRGMSILNVNARLSIDTNDVYSYIRKYIHMYMGKKLS